MTEPWQAWGRFRKGRPRDGVTSTGVVDELYTIHWRSPLRRGAVRLLPEMK
jgi:hypothetical protein